MGAGHARGWEYMPIYPEQPQSSLTPAERSLLCLAHRSELAELKFGSFSFVCLILVHGDPRKRVKSWIKTGHNNKLSLENKTNLYASKERKEMHVREKRICREMVLPEGGWGKQSRRHKAHLLPPAPAGTDGCTAIPPYLLCGDHGDHIRSLLPHHLPEVMACVWQRPLSGDVVPFCPTNHHLETKASISE